MKAIFTVLVLSLFVISVLPGVLAAVGAGVTPDIQTEDFEPRVWACDHRVVLDDPVQSGRVSWGDQGMMERDHNYAFEGESISWIVLAMDKNGIDKIMDVFASIGPAQGAGNDIEVNCQRIGWQGEQTFDMCNARILEEEVEWNPDLMDFYSCTLTVESSESMYGEYWVTVEAIDMDDLSGTMAENEYWFFNPIIGLAIHGDLTFEDVRPGATSYSSTLLLENDGEDAGESGVELDMFISGTNFYDSDSSAAMCPTTNELSLSAFKYFATNGAYSTQLDAEEDNCLEGCYDVHTDRARDSEGYVNIQYGNHWDRSMYYEAEILQAGFQPEPPFDPGSSVGYYRGNLLTPGAEMALTFKLELPEPCNGDFDTGEIFFWAEAV